MRKIAIFTVLIALATPALAKSVFVQGYVRKDGTYVPPHVRTAPNNSTIDNWSTAPNVNPYTGEQGAQDWVPQYQPVRPNRTIQPVQPIQPCIKALASLCECAYMRRCYGHFSNSQRIWAFAG